MRARLFVDLCQRFGSCCGSEKTKNDVAMRGKDL
jgi:hypothetical protein